MNKNELIFKQDPESGLYSPYVFGDDILIEGKTYKYIGIDKCHDDSILVWDSMSDSLIFGRIDEPNAIVSEKIENKTSFLSRLLNKFKL